MLKAGTVITPFMLRTGADVEIVLRFSARTFPAWEVTVNETERYG